MSSTGCATRVIRNDQVLVPLSAGVSYTPQMDGWFMSDATYMRVREAVADRVLELRTSPVGPLKRQPETSPVGPLSRDGSATNEGTK